MSDLRRVTHASMASLCHWFGCLDAVAEAINARWQAGSCKGTISKKVNGQLDWTLADVIAIEDAAGRFPVTRMLARRLDQRISEPPGNLVAQSGIIAKETGEAVSAILAAEQSLDGQERARAITEIDEAIVALRAARARLEQPAAALVSVQS